ncbi:Aste57867_21279 [Aphanomyces stellatus]|uniref:Aste57867_21279 protein n=1 Tax=Aphanomyces stellatus TaxID=120398 RepID=A0A485LJ74_9STRA|nr:hypothetical protein As57867_021210 [Aphanomyces stellatus]VFT97951.1 Aste57867_21279 [Aphanomyces stellatus]
MDRPVVGSRRRLIPDARIFHIHRFGTWMIEIDFTSTENAQVELERITAAVEAECPAGKHFGVSGIGEGVVWTYVPYPSSRFWFKLQPAGIGPEEVASIEAFVDMYVSNGRLSQGLTILAERGIECNVQATGIFVQWVQGDVVKEEGDTMAANDLHVKRVLAAVANKARDWFKRAIAVEARDD